MTNLTQLRQPDFSQFLKAITRQGRPAHVPCYEHFASGGFIARRMEMPFERLGVDDPDYWPIFVAFWLGMGFDCVPMEIPLNCPLPAGHGRTTEESEAKVCIRSWEDFERYPWPSEEAPIDFRHFETVAALLPDGAKIVGGVCMGPYEWASTMLGTVGMAYLLADDPALVAAVFARLGRLHASAVRQLASMDAIGALRQGDDLGFKTATFLPPALLREHVFPIYARMVAAAHARGKPFILHSCGNLTRVYDDLIACGIDAKHSFEDVIQPVEAFKAQYGDRVTPLGGLDVDVICRAPEDELRAYTRRKVEACFADGHWTLGTGNSLPEYMPVERYLMVLEEGRRAAAAL